MKIVKEKQFFIFHLDDGKTVKYDLSTGQVIGKKGQPVKSINTQLRGYDISNILDSFEDSGYRNYFKAIYHDQSYNISNMGTLLNRASQYRTAEQYYIIGVKVPINWRTPISEIPKGLLNICKKHNLLLEKTFLESYKIFTNEINWAFNQEFYYLTPLQLNLIFTLHERIYDRDCLRFCNKYKFKFLQENNYDYKALLRYIDNLAAFEGLEDINYVLVELCDYVNMMKKLSPKFDKYPCYFLTTHKIATRNYNRLKQQFDEEAFQKRYTEKYNITYKDYIFTYPKTIQDIKDEAVSQSNCVASYIQSVLNDKCYIIFMRYKDTPDTSLVTIEIRNDQIVQAKGAYNRELTLPEKEAVDYFNNKFNTRKEQKTA